jgi:hypothetical protein
MKSTHNLKAMKAEQLDPGDLFLVDDGNGSYVALMVKDDTGPLMLLLGPPSSEAVEFPTLTGCPANIVVASFSKNFSIHLPVEPKSWLSKEPKTGLCLVLSQDKLYIRTDRKLAGVIERVSIGIANGLIFRIDRRLAHPEDCIYVNRWTILTADDPPRETFRC